MNPRPDPKTCPHPSHTIGRTIAADGKSLVWPRCDTCGANTLGPGKWIPLQKIGQILEALPVFESYVEQRPPCARCGKWGTQLHHFFPRHVMGRTEAELWPTAWLCQDCHDRWHQLVDRIAS